MRRRGTWLVLGAALVVFGLLVVLQPRGQVDTTDYSSDSYGAHGTTALRRFAEVRGHSTSQLRNDFTAPATPGLLFIFRPDVQPLSASDVQILKLWLAAGWVVVYADSDVDRQMRLNFGLATGGYTDGQAVAAIPAFGSGLRVGTDEPAQSWRPSPDQAPLFISERGGLPLVIEERAGAGRLIAISSPDLLSNGSIASKDNWHFAAGLLSMTTGPVLFDEYHHNPYAGAAPRSWVDEPWGIALILLLAIGFIGFALRGRAFGPRLGPAIPPDRSSAEYAAAVGSLLRAAGGREMVARRLWEDSVQAVAARRASPEARTELAQAESELAGASSSEQSLLNVARRLHRLAYPVSPRDSR